MHYYMFLIPWYSSEALLRIIFIIFICQRVWVVSNLSSLTNLVKSTLIWFEHQPHFLIIFPVHHVKGIAWNIKKKKWKSLALKRHLTYFCLGLKHYIYWYHKLYHYWLQGVTTEPMVTTVLTTVVVTVWTTLHVTNRLDTVTEDVNLDILIKIVTKVKLQINVYMMQRNLLNFFSAW